MNKWKDVLCMFLDQKQLKCKDGYFYPVVYRFHAIPIKMPSLFYVGDTKLH